MSHGCRREAQSREDAVGHLNLQRSERNLSIGVARYARYWDHIFFNDSVSGHGILTMCLCINTEHIQTHIYPSTCTCVCMFLYIWMREKPGTQTVPPSLPRSSFGRASP